MENSNKLYTYDIDSPMLDRVRRDRQARAQVYVYPQRAVILGRGSKLQTEVFAGQASADGLSVLRRAGGGCAVYLDPGNVICSIALPLGGLGKNREAFDAISQTLIGALASLGLSDVVQRGISDLTQQGNKIGGSCIHRAKDILYYSTTLLVEPEIGAMQRYLRHPPREPDYRAGRAHHHFVAALIRDGSGEKYHPQQLARLLAERLNEEEIMGFRLYSDFVNLT